MKYSIILSPEAKNSLHKLKGNLRSIIRDGIIEHLSFEPEKVSKSRIKRLKGVEKPQFRLRIEDVRIYYDVFKNTVEILTIVTKEKAQEWLERHGN
jgi:mRNA-degrading endonuclease RelE of RelBE toxin-antitoxin system